MLCFLLSGGVGPIIDREEPRAVCAPGMQLTLLALETGVYPQDWFRVHLDEVTGSSAPSVLPGR